MSKQTNSIVANKICVVSKIGLGTGIFGKMAVKGLRSSPVAYPMMGRGATAPEPAGAACSTPVGYLVGSIGYGRKGMIGNKRGGEDWKLRRNSIHLGLDAVCALEHRASTLA